MLDLEVVVSTLDQLIIDNYESSTLFHELRSRETAPRKLNLEKQIC